MKNNGLLIHPVVCYKILNKLNIYKLILIFFSFLILNINFILLYKQNDDWKDIQNNSYTI